jgi:ATP-dependent RNA helicase RhlB
MPSFIEKIGKLFKKQEVYRPSQAAPATKPAKESRKAHPKAQVPPKRSTHRGGRKPKQAGKPAAETAQRPTPVRKTTELWDPSTFQVEPQEGKTRFQDMNLPVDIFHAIADLNFKYCTPIQAEILPLTLAGKDMAGKAQTGTGKTAAFLLCILTRFMKNKQEAPKPGTPRALILAPTRELAMQIRDDAEKLSTYTPFKTVAIYGGIDYDKQRRVLEQPVDIIVAAPPHRLRQPGRHQPARSRSTRHRRSRPHARHGLHPRRPQNRLQNPA